MIQKFKVSFMGIVTLIACAFLTSCGDDDNESGEIYKTGVHKIVVEQSGDTNAIYMTCSGAVHNIIDEPGKKLKVIVTAYINDKEVNRLTKEYETAQEDLIETFRVSTTTE